MKKEQLPKNRLVYLEAFPFYHSVLDVCQLEAEERDFAKLLVEQLVLGKLEITFQSHSSSEEKLHHLYFDSKNRERTDGQRCSALGFPLLLSKQESSVSMAPLLTWPVTIDPDPHRPNFWTIRSQTDRGPKLNPLLSDLIPSDEPVPVPGWEAFQTPSLESLQQFGQKLAAWLSAEWQESWVEPFPVPPLEVLGDLAGQRVILPCMVMGSFKPVFSYREDELAWTSIQEEDPEPEEIKQPFESSVFSPFQAAAWERARKEKRLLIGNQDQGDSQDWVFELITNALSNGERCLVLSDRIGRLSQLQNRFSARGQDGLCFVLKDPYQDSYLLAELLKARAGKEEAPVSFPKNDFKAALAKCIRQKEKLDQSYLALQKPLLGVHNWTELAGLFLKSSAIEGKELLSNQLTTQDFQFQSEEYELLKKIIADSIPLYNRLNTLKHPLSALHPSRVLDYDKATSLRQIERLIAEFSEELERLNHDVLRQTDAYALKLNDHFENGFLALNARLQQTQELFSDHSNKFGEAFLKSGAGVISFKGIFQQQAKALKAAVEATIQSYQALGRNHQSHNFFDFDFLSTAESKNMAKVRASMNRYKEALGDWRQKIRDRVMEEVTRLNKQTVFPELNLVDSIASLEDQIDASLRKFNEACIYGETVDANMLTIPKKQKFLDSLLEKLETTRLNLRDFDPFYDWQRHWLQLSEPQQRLIRALIKVKPKNWTSAFESWYFHHCLNRSFSDDLPTDDQALESFYDAWTSLRSYLPSQIRQIWQEREQKAIKSWKKNNKPGYLSWMGKTKREGGPFQWFDGNWDALHDLFPVWMTTDSMAASLYSGDNAPELDWVIIWEHQELEPALWEALVHRVKHWVVVSGESGKGWKMLRKKGWPSETLKALPVQRVWEDLVPGETGPEIARDVRFVQVSGLYDFSRHTNEAEAQEVIRLLNEIRPTPSRTFPSVGILTLSIEQRDLIATYLLQIKQRNLQGSEKIRSLERNGLAVLHIDEFFGSVFDQLIISTTFGPVNVQGALPADLTYLSSDAWEQAAQALLQSPFSSCVLLHSFNDAQLSTPELARLQGMFRNIAPGAARKGPSGKLGMVPEFNREIRPILQGYFDGWEFSLLAREETHVLPLLLNHGKNKDFRAAIITDLFIGCTPYTSYTWENEVRKQLKGKGLFLQNVWSVLCWRNPRQEARKIASRIISAYNRTLKEEGKQENVPEEPPVSDTQ